MNIRFVAQSGFILESNGKRIAIDLWLSNPVHPLTLADIPHIDYFFLTHDHGDHGMQDMIALAQRDNACFVATPEIAMKVESHGVKRVEDYSLGGEFKLDAALSAFGTNALHTSETGFPSGIIIIFDGKVIYHTGDTAYMEDFKFYSELYMIDVLMLPIGGRYTMGPREAAYAVRDLKPKITIPMHYNTFDQIEQDPDVFIQRLKQKNVTTDVRRMQWGEDIEI